MPGVIFECHHASLSETSVTTLIVAPRDPLFSKTGSRGAPSPARKRATTSVTGSLELPTVTIERDPGTCHSVADLQKHGRRHYRWILTPDAQHRTRKTTQ